MTTAPSGCEESRMAKNPIRIGNCSGFYGDRIIAAREMVEGGPLDILTGDYLAELTMVILDKARRTNPDAGYAVTFLTQMEQVLGTCLDRGIRIVSNAGGLNPKGLAEAIHRLAERLGLHPKISYLTGDDMVDRIDSLIAAGIDFTHLDTGLPLGIEHRAVLTANVYLGGWGIAKGLSAGADVVVCPRVADASIVVGPAAWWHGWADDAWDALAGAVAAGHVIECGTQATGGNYSLSQEITDKRYPGFPIAEIYDDGSSVITKHADTGGLVSVGTVSAQLLYEIAAPAYLNPDVVAHFDTLHLENAGEHRVRISGTTGSPPPETLKVAVNLHGGYRNAMTFVLTGLDIEDNAARAESMLFDLLGGKAQFADTDVRVLRFDRPDAPSNVQATAHLQITVKDEDPNKVGRAFSDAAMDLALASYAGLHTTTPPRPESSFALYWPCLVPRTAVQQTLVLPDQTQVVIGDPPTSADGPHRIEPEPNTAPISVARSTHRMPLGRICAARSGDKGGNANVGLWTRTGEQFDWLRNYLTVERLRELVPEAAKLRIERYPLPNIYALNFVLYGLLDDGVASTARPDPQAKGLGEYLRSRLVDVPAELVRP